MPYLIGNAESAHPEIYELRLGENTIGRELDNTIIICNGSVSRYHAKIIIVDEYAIVEDLKSLNFTWVNGNKIAQYYLKDGDLVRFGNIAFKFVYYLSNRVQSLPEEEPQLSIIKRISPEQARVTIQELLQNYPDNQGSILNLRQQESNQRAVDKLKILLEVSKQLSSPEEPHRLLEKILDLLFNIVSVDRAVILLVNEETGTLEPKAARFRPGIPIDEQFYSTKITNFVCQNGDAILTNDASIDKRLINAASIIQQRILASMCVPLKPRDNTIGVLYVDNLSMVNIYSEEDLEFLTALVNQAAIALDNARLYKKMQAEAVMRAKLELFFPQAVSKKLKEEDELEIVETEVTALFADISNFTEMSSRMEPRQVIEMLNEYFKVMVEDIVFHYEGTLEKYIGDALLAIWGAPYQQVDDADRAVKAAIAMQWAVRRLNERWMQQRNLQIQIHIGLNTGKVAAGNIGSPRLIQYAAIGDTTNVTSRICSAAQASEILMSQSTWEKLRDRTLPIVKIPPVLVKGKDQPLQLYRLLWEQLNQF